MTTGTSSRLELQLRPTPHAPGIARRRLAEKFASDLDRDKLRDAKLLTTELVTNALIHGRGAIELRALLAWNRLTVDVTDRGAGFERTAREHDPDSVGGWGLMIVNALASRWGVEKGSSHVWFELERLARRPGSTDQSRSHASP